MSEKIIKNWIALSEYDLKTAEAMLAARRYIYVAFMCQQAIEKILKAVYVQEQKKTPPYTHNLSRLVELLSLSDHMSSAQKEFLEKLNYYYLESRYSEDLAELSHVLTEQDSVLLLKETEEIYQWLRDWMK